MIGFLKFFVVFFVICEKFKLIIFILGCFLKWVRLIMLLIRFVKCWI